MTTGQENINNTPGEHTDKKAQLDLVRKINHRVKNSFAAIISILHMEQLKVRNTDVPSETLVTDLLCRVQSFMTVYGLIAHNGWNPVSLTSLCEDVIKAGSRSLHVSGKLSFKISGPDIRVDYNLAHNLALVITELMMNTVKHGLNETGQGEIIIDMIKEEESIIICFRDNGEGYPEELLNGTFPVESIGFELIKGIVEHTLGGLVEIKNENGAVTKIKFEYKPQ